MEDDEDSNTEEYDEDEDEEESRTKMEFTKKEHLKYNKEDTEKNGVSKKGYTKEKKDTQTWQKCFVLPKYLMSIIIATMPVKTIQISMGLLNHK